MSLAERAVSPGIVSRRSLDMPMRASQPEQTGGAGVSEVAGAFERINWGTAENARHDLGTDLFLMARDERRFDLGSVVGAQVKAGPSYFYEPKRDDAAISSAGGSATTTASTSTRGSLTAFPTWSCSTT
jgi:hypothetical protein